MQSNDRFDIAGESASWYYITMKWKVQGKIRLKAFLSRQLPLPEYRIRALLDKKLVRVEEQAVKNDMELTSGMTVEVRLPRNFLPRVPILYEGPDYLVVEKPRGIEVCDSETGALTLTDVLHALGYPEALPCHRLDVHTGGVMLFARGQAAEETARELFVSHSLSKRYLCVCVGAPRRNSGDVSAYLYRKGGRSYITDRPMPGAQDIRTIYRILRRAGDVSLAEVDLVTGRTHQIRAHFASWGTPLLGDDLYGIRDVNREFKLRYPCLWAVELHFPEGLTGPLTPLSGQSFGSEPQFPQVVKEMFGV